MKFQFFAGLVTLALSSSAFAGISITANGTGCPIQDGKTIPYGFDGQWLTLEVNKAFAVKAQKGNGISLEESRKNCAFNVNLDGQGYRYAVDRVVTWGSYSLGANDSFVSSFDGFYQGDGDTAVASTEVVGPVGYEYYNYDKTLSGSNLIWSECSNDRVLTLNTAVRVSPKGNNGKHATRSTATLDRVAFHFVFKKC